MLDVAFMGHRLGLTLSRLSPALPILPELEDGRLLDKVADSTFRVVTTGEMLKGVQAFNGRKRNHWLA
jgi:hypothetical protein